MNFNPSECFKGFPWRIWVNDVEHKVAEAFFYNINGKSVFETDAMKGFLEFEGNATFEGNIATITSES